MKPFIIALAMAFAAWADITQSATFSDGLYLSLDTGATTQAPATGDIYDIRWSGGTINPIGKAKILNLGIRTAGQFDLITQSDVTLRLAGSTSARDIPAANLVAGDVFYVLTNFGNPSKVYVQRAGSGSLIVNFVTYQSAPPGAPTVTAVLNNSSLIDSLLPNGGIAPSSLFIVRGKGMADAGDPVLQSSATPGLPLSLNGASIAVTVNGITTHPALYYTSPTQVAAVLPANTPVGNGNLTMTYHGLASAPFAIRVVRAAPGLNTYGTNTGVATDANGSVLTFTNSASPGQTIVLWATGIGADPSDSDTTFSSSPHAINSNLQVFFGGASARILYQGSAGYPGVNQINVVIPDSVATGCWVPVAAVVDTTVSNIATLPITKGGGECFDTVTGYKGSQLAPSGGATFRAGFVGLFQADTPGANGSRTLQYGSSANFSRYTGVTYDPANQLSPGGCIIRQAQPMISGITGLPAGTITLTGPGGLNVALQNTLGIAGAYNVTLSTIPPSGGTYTWTGSGGTGVGPFTSTLNLTSPLLTWTNPSVATTVEPGSGMKVTWTGGNPGSYVEVSGGSTARINSTTVVANYSCLEHVEAGQFTVPSYILQALPVGPASTDVSNIIYFPLSASGVDFASGLTTIGHTMSTTLSIGK
jgi:uncharacterized protein (TIGR03437 family)